MTYQVLARKWRPRDFASLVGQDHVVRALSHALDQQRLHHAYLFTGTRGVGKTTLSRILAKAFNCERGIGSTPCGVCRACVDIDAGRFVDYVEMDAASNRGVDEMAALLERAVYAPVDARFKVYMIDEVHMLTNHAFNAMLKTLEEPPAHVKFILATTDPQKIPVTVLSRCLQFNLKQMPANDIVAHLQRVLAAEAIDSEPQALRLLARAADGSMRDALSLTDQGIAFAAGTLTEEAIRAMLGALDQQYLERLLDALIASDGPAVLAIADDMAARSLSFATALQDLAQWLNRIGWAQFAPGSVLDDWPEADAIRRFAGMMNPQTVQLYYQIATIGRSELGLAPDEYGGFTMTLLRMLAFEPVTNLSGMGGTGGGTSAAGVSDGRATHAVSAAKPASSTASSAAAQPVPPVSTRPLAAARAADPVTVNATAAAPAAPVATVAVTAGIAGIAGIAGTAGTAGTAVTAAPPIPSVTTFPTTVDVDAAEPETPAVLSPVSPKAEAPAPGYASPAQAALAALGIRPAGRSIKPIDGARAVTPVIAPAAPRTTTPRGNAAPAEGGATASRTIASRSAAAPPSASRVSGAPVQGGAAANTRAAQDDWGMAGDAPWDEDADATAFLASTASWNESSFQDPRENRENTVGATSAARPAAASAVVAPAAPPAPLPDAVSLRTLGFERDWPSLVSALDVKGLAHQLAFQSELTAVDGHTLTLCVPMAHLATGAHVEKLNMALSQRLECAVTLRIETGAARRTAAAVVAIAQAHAQQQADQVIQNDPFVQALLRDFGGTIVPGSTRPVSKETLVKEQRK